MALPGHSQTELISRRDVNIKMGRFGSRAGAGKPRSRKRRGISHWRIDECCEAPREEHGDIRLLANGKELVKRRQYENGSIYNGISLICEKLAFFRFFFQGQTWEIY